MNRSASAEPESTLAETSATAAAELAEPKGARRGERDAALGKNTSTEANRRAAAILEVLAGVRLPSEAAAALGVSVTHYYVLERKALEGLLAACEPQPRGRSGPTADETAERLRRELAECRQECQRQAALVRATQRAVGLSACAAASEPPRKRGRPGKGGRGRKPGAVAGRRRRRPTVRALRAAAALEKRGGLLPGDESTVQQPLPTSAGDTAASSQAEQDG